MQNRECIVFEQTRDTKSMSRVRVCESHAHPLINQSSGGYSFASKFIVSWKQRKYVVKLGFQILYSVELFSSPFSQDKRKARSTHTPTHDPTSLCVVGKLPCRGPVVWSWCLKECFALPTAIRHRGFLCSLTRWWNNCLWLPLPA